MNRAWKWYLAAGVPLTVLYLWLPTNSAKLYVWPLIGWSAVIAILVGVRVNRPDAQLAWHLLAAGVATLVLGDNLYSFRSFLSGRDPSFPSYVDIVYLAMYPLLIGGLAMLLHRRTDGRDRAGVIDAAIITAGLGLVSWVMLIAPYVRIDDFSVLERLIAIAYPLGDVALLATAVRLAVGGGRRPPAFWLLTGSLVSLLGADALFGYSNLAGTWHEHNPVDIGWALFYFGWGAAALHPSMRALSMPTASSTRINTARLVVIGSAVLVSPAVLLVQGLRGSVTDAAAIAAASAILFVLVLVRTSDLTRAAADKRGEARFRALVNNAFDAVVVIDDDGLLRYWTPSTERVLGRRGAELVSRHITDFLEDADARRLLVMLSNELATDTVEWRIRTGEAGDERGDDGGWRDLEVAVADMRGTADVGGLVLTMRDITRRKHLDEELRRQALHDSLTGLPNRTLFLDRVEQALKRSQRDDGSMAVLLLDVDDFKVVNDSLGHAAGDELLQAVAARLLTAIQTGDTVARLGGDEFALLVEHRDVAAVLELAALRVQAVLQAPIVVRGEQISVRVSIGMAIGSPGTHVPDDLLRDADLAMYVAKRKGKDRFEQFVPAMHEVANRRLEVAAELRDAIDRHEFVVFYQPIVDVVSGRALGAEALVRWQHPSRGLLETNEFVPIAEATGLIVPIGRLMLDEACRATEAWKRAGIADDAFYISVNVSALHVQDGCVLDDVTAALEVSGLAAEALVLEVTETALIEDLNPTGSTLAALKELGLRIAADDFGTGYSSLSYLSNLPLDILKIDKSFVDRVATSAEGETMVRAVLDLAHTLGLTAIAEGVEDVEQGLALERMGCRLAQGFLYAKPMPAPEIAALLAAQSLRARKRRDDSAATTKRR